MAETMQFGFHLTVDVYKSPLTDKLNDMQFCHNILTQLVDLLEMHALIPPYIIPATSNEEEGGKDPGGITGMIVIAESHISIHTFPKRGFVSMDIYSCKVFDYDKAVEFLKEKFATDDMEIHKLDRGTRYPVKNIF